MTLATWGFPNASQRATKSELGHQWADWQHHPCRMGGPQRFIKSNKIRGGPQVCGLATSRLAAWGVPNILEPGRKLKVAHKWADWLNHPCRMGGPQHFRAGDKIRSGPQMGGLATSPMPYGRSPTLHRGDGLRSGPQMDGLATSPCRMGGPHRFRLVDTITSGLQVGRLATSPLLYGGSPTLESGGQNEKWPTNGQIGYITPAVWGVPNALEWGTKSEVAHKWADWLHHPCRIGGPRRFRAGDQT